VLDYDYYRANRNVMYVYTLYEARTLDTRLFLAIDGTIALSLRYSDSLMEAWRYLRQTLCPAKMGGFERALFTFLISRNISISNSRLNTWLTVNSDRWNSSTKLYQMSTERR